MDKYSSFEHLRQKEREGESYRIRIRKGNRLVAVVAPHGGAIEPGTSEIAEAIAGCDYTLYSFEGIKAAHNFEMHITSASFDEPFGVSIVKNARLVIAVHGCSGNGEVIYVGGRDSELKGRICAALLSAGFPVEECSRPGLRGTDARNICNRGLTGAGVQLEISRGLRRTMLNYPKNGVGPIKTALFHRFVHVLRGVLADILERDPPCGASEGHRRETPNFT
jgi:phage replication-related protein YjqB (UPF0714/DUF867 family)